jgi:hypothetical protein
MIPKGEFSFFSHILKFRRAVELEAKMLEYLKSQEEKKGGKLKKSISSIKPIGKVKITCNALPIKNSLIFST